MLTLTYLERKLDDWQKRLSSLSAGTWDLKEAKEQIKILQRQIDAMARKPYTITTQPGIELYRARI